MAGLLNLNPSMRAVHKKLIYKSPSFQFHFQTISKENNHKGEYIIR